MKNFNRFLCSFLIVGLFGLLFTCACKHNTPGTAISPTGNDVGMTVIALPPPQKTIGKPLMQVLNERKTTRKFSDQDLPIQELSNLLWAGFGINRPEKGYRTAPSAVNWQVIDIYVALKSGVYIYNAKNHALLPVLAGDVRNQAVHPLQPLRGSVLKAPVILLYIADGKKRSILEKAMSLEERAMYENCDAGFISENVYLYCASQGLATVVRGMVDRPLLAAKMNLRPEQRILLSQTVGYRK